MQYGSAPAPDPDAPAVAAVTEPAAASAMRATMQPARRTVADATKHDFGVAGGSDFASLYSQGFARPGCRGAPCPDRRNSEFNAARTIELAGRASEQQAAVVVFPELGLSGYSIEDLFHQQALLDGVVEGLAVAIRQASADLVPVLVVGAPLRADSGIFNTAVVIHRGRILGVVPKSYLPEYHEFYEKRHFRAARDAVIDELDLLAERVPFGSRLLFACRDIPELCLHVEVCEDLWAPIPPSTYGALAGATVLAKPLRQQRHGGQGRLPPAPLRVAVGPCDRRLRLHLGRAGGIDHRPGLGRPGARL